MTENVVPGTDPVEPESNKCKITISICLLIYMNFMQYAYRYTAVGVMKPLSEYFTMENKDIGMMQTSYLIASVLLNPLCGYLGDRYNRKWILIVSMVIWAIGIGATLLCKQQHFILFLVLRAVIGVGDGIYAVIAPIVISDMYSLERRSTFLMIFFCSIPIGSGIGLIFGARVYLWTKSWQAATGFPAALGLLGIILMVIFLYEPKRGFFENAKQEVSNGTFWQDIVYLLKIKSFSFLNVAMAGRLFMLGALAFWGAQYISLGYAISSNQTEVTSDILKEVSLVVGVMLVVCGIIGLAGGTLIARAWRNGKWCFKNCATMKADAYVCCIAMTLATPLVVFFLVYANRNIILVYVLVHVIVALVSVNWAIDIDLTMLVIVPSKRSSAVSLQTLFIRIFGDMFSSYIVGSISDAFKDTDSLESKYYSLQYALLLLSVTVFISGMCYAIYTFTMKGDRRRCLEAIEEENRAKLIQNIK